MTIARAVEQYLVSHHVPFDLVEHPRSMSSARSAELAHVSGRQVAKSVLLEDANGYLLAIIPSTHRVDLGKLHRDLHRQVGLAVENDVYAIFADCQPGAVPALAAAYELDSVVDETLLEQDDVYFEAGDHEALVRLSGPQFSVLMKGGARGHFAR
jgi:Ala-tRNA(Pro) deacylase